MGMGSLGSIGNTYLNFMVGGGNGIVTDSIRHAVRNRAANNQTYLGSIYRGISDGFVRSHLKNKKNGGFFTGFWQNTKNALGEFKIEKSKIATSKNTFRGLTKIIPIALAVYGTLSGIPNIYKAFRDEGLKAGLKETVKTAGKLTTAAILSTLAGGLIRIPALPFIGASYGYIAGEQLGDTIGGKTADFIFGKSYTEKMKDLRKQQEKIAKEQEKETVKEEKKLEKKLAKLEKRSPHKLDIMSYVE